MGNVHTSARATATATPAATASSAAADPPELRVATATAPDHAASADLLPVSSASAPLGSHLAAGAERKNSARPLGCHDASLPPSAIDGPGRVMAAGPSAADRLHRHALEHIFAFLGMRELASALRVSRDWLAAVRSMRRLELQIGWLRAPLAVISRSLMGRHVAAIVRGEDDVQLSVADLAVLAERMAHLRELDFDIALPPPDQPPLLLRFPDQLRTLRIQLTVPGDADTAQVNGAIAAIGRLSLLEQLDIFLTAVDPHVSFAPLITLPLLRHFGFRYFCDPAELSDAQVNELRALPHVQTLYVDMTIGLLRRLLRQPLQLQLQLISPPSPFDDEAAALLAQLPSLTQIVCFGLRCTRFEWLLHLPNVTDVDLNFESLQGAAGRIEALVAVLQRCTSIETLTLGYCSDLTATHLAVLLPRLPRLRELTLRELRIDSLAFLSQAPMTTQLSSLDLSFCRQLPVADLRHVHTLRGLNRLNLSYSFAAPLDASVRSLLEPPSAVLPLLRSFGYVEPDH